MPLDIMDNSEIVYDQSFRCGDGEQYSLKTDFDHLYASSVGSTRDSSLTSMNAAQSYLSSCHLNMIEEQARIIESQNQEITKLRKQNESLIARIERMNRRLNLYQCNGRTPSRKNEFVHNQSTSAVSTNEKNNASTDENSFPDDQPSKLIPFGSESSDEHCESAPNSDSREIRKTSTGDVTNVGDEGNTERHISNTENCKSNFRIQFRRNELTLNDDLRKRNKMVRFVEAKRSNSSPAAMMPKRNNAQTVDDKLKMEREILFLNSGVGEKSTKFNLNEHHNQKAESSATESDDISVSKKRKKKVKLPILTTNEPYFMTVRENACHLYDPVTYTPTALEVPSFRVIENDNINPADVPKDYYEDITTATATERHTRFEIAERKRKKWDVQRLRELRQNERLKEKLRRRKSRWNKLEQPAQTNNETLEQITMLFPHIKSIEKIIITDCVPVTALGTSIPKIPTWGSEFHTKWLNDGTIDASQFESDHVMNPQPHQQHHRESRSRTT